MGSMDAGDFVLTVGNREIHEFTGLRDWKLETDTTFNEGPGGRKFGFNLQRPSHSHMGVTFSFTVRETSPDIGYLYELIRAQTEVAITAEVPEEKRDIYEAGQEVGLGAMRCILKNGSRGKGTGDAEDVTFEVMAIGPTTIYKSAGADSETTEE